MCHEFYFHCSKSLIAEPSNLSLTAETDWPWGSIEPRLRTTVLGQKPQGKSHPDITQSTYLYTSFIYGPDRAEKCNSHFNFPFLRSKLAICVCCITSDTNCTFTSGKLKICTKVALFRSIWMRYKVLMRCKCYWNIEINSCSGYVCIYDVNVRNLR